MKTLCFHLVVKSEQELYFNSKTLDGGNLREFSNMGVRQISRELFEVAVSALICTVVRHAHQISV